MFKHLPLEGLLIKMNLFTLQPDHGHGGKQAYIYQTKLTLTIVTVQFIAMQVLFLIQQVGLKINT